MENTMREAYRDELDAISGRLVEMTRATGEAMAQASESLLATDIALAERVISADRSVDRLRDDLDDRVVDLLARQQPVATELRIVVTALRMADDIERMGDLALHIAKLTRLRYPQPVIPDLMRLEFATMGTIAYRLSSRLSSIIADHDPEGASELDHDDDEMDTLHRRHFAVLTADSWPHGVQAAIDVTLASRYYERYADHTVKCARRVYYLVTGSRPSASGSLR
jgi:phosphate transport system protein